MTTTLKAQSVHHQPTATGLVAVLAAFTRRAQGAVRLLIIEMRKAWASDHLYTELSLRTNSELARRELNRDILARYVWERIYADGDSPRPFTTPQSLRKPRSA